ncbi:MAG TPA: DUF433 domain-containing protein [Terracidiphilus sp.]|nr:DUF433 domain-containing protein [Terracidiphilus sp.]
MDRLWTIREAAAIAQLSAKTIRSTIDREGLKRGQADEGREWAGYSLSLRDLIYIKLRAEFPFALSKADRAALEALVRGRKAAASGWRAAGQELVLQSASITVNVDYGRLRETVTRNAAAFEWGQQRIVSDLAIHGGEPIFRGTRILLAEVVSLIRKGMSDLQLAEKYPALLEVDFDYARIFARLGKRPGRPRKPMEVHRNAEAA